MNNKEKFVCFIGALGVVYSGVTFYEKGFIPTSQEGSAQSVSQDIQSDELQRLAPKVQEALHILMDSSDEDKILAVAKWDSINVNKKLSIAPADEIHGKGVGVVETRDENGNVQSYLAFSSTVFLSEQYSAADRANMLYQGLVEYDQSTNKHAAGSSDLSAK